MKHNSEYRHAQVLGWWLMCCAATVFVMVVVGGVTRLTQSGLSMVEWAPIMGIIPPLNQTEWMAVFEKYRLSPEYLKINAGMSLDEFKSIFYWEYGHRVLGRIIGLIYLLPLLYFLVRGMVPRGWYGRLAALFILGGLQGLLGWYMVKSGLVDVPHVSQYRLTAHLGLAVVIFATMLWYAMDFLRGERPAGHATIGYMRLTAWGVVVVFVMILSGGFVAGTKAGFIMNTFPTMNGHWIPQGVAAMQPFWHNLFENPVTVQFIHRCLALLVVASILACFWASVRQTFSTRAWLLLCAMTLQVALGISALLLRVPVWAGAAHQAGAVALLAAALYVAHRARKQAVEFERPRVTQDSLPN
ncbi:COX15/CtaA family protein [Arenicella chitinivorans]|nr:COX15/CtaA family protein [Arenicella chitinivorans]